MDSALYLIFRSLFFALGWIFFLLPGRVRLLAGNALGFFLQRLGLRKKVIAENLARVFPGDSAKQVALFRDAYRHLGNLILEFFFVFGPMPAFVARRREVKGDEHWIAAKKTGRGVIFLASHLGNWEIMGAVGGQIHFRELLFVTKRLKPAWFHRLVENARASYGVSGTYEPRTLKDVLSALKKNRTVGFVQDQYVGPPTGIRVPFFGVHVGTSRVVATLAKRTGAVILPVYNLRRDDGSYIIVIEPALPWITDTDPERELRLNTEAYTARIEAQIRMHPAQWLWSHRRFKGDLGPLLPGE